jgi:ABC-type sugar transport system ATPase subunit
VSKYLVEMTGISKSFPGVNALKNVDLSLNKGEILGLVGENGAGKSTLMKVLSGYFPRNSYDGKIYINKKEITINTITDAENNNISLIPQEISLVQELSIGENIYLNHEPNKLGLINEEKLYSNSKFHMEKLNLKLDPRMQVKNCSIAIQGLISIAKALSKEIKILILDEPTAFLTEDEIAILFNILKNLKKEGISSIFISHKISEIFEICDRVSVMRDGEMIRTKNIAETNKEELIEIMINRNISNMFPKEFIEIGDILFEIKNFYVRNAKTKRYIVNDVSFSARRGEVVGIFGLVGSGRTELAMSIFGVTPKNLYSGEVYLYGKKVSINSPGSAIKNRLGFITEDKQKFGLFLDFDIKFNISISNLDAVSNMFVINDDKEVQYTQKLVNQLKIKIANLNSKAKQLSGGNQQKVILAKWLAKNLNVLILDEPTKGIDVGAKVEIYKLINELSKKNMAIILISSELPEILGMSDRILVMHRGFLKGELKRDHASESKILHLATGGLFEEIN